MVTVGSKLSWIKAASLKAKVRKLKVTLRCAGGTTACVGKLALTAKLHGKKASKLASVRFTIAADKRKTLTLKISAATVSWLKAHHHKLTATLKVEPTGAKSASHKIKIVGT